MGVLLPKPTATFSVSAEIGILRAIAPFQQPGSETAAQSRAAVERFDHHHKRRLTDCFHHDLIHNIKAGFIDQAYVNAILFQSFHRIQTAIQGFAKTDDVAPGHTADIANYDDASGNHAPELSLNRELIYLLNQYKNTETQAMEQGYDQYELTITRLTGDILTILLEHLEFNAEQYQWPPTHSI